MKLGINDSLFLFSSSLFPLQKDNTEAQEEAISSMALYMKNRRQALGLQRTVVPTSQVKWLPRVRNHGMMKSMQ